MARYLYFKLLFAFKYNFNGGQFCREKSKFGFFNNLQIILNRVKKSQNLQLLNIWDGKLIKNEMFIIETINNI